MKTLLGLATFHVLVTAFLDFRWPNYSSYTWLIETSKTMLQLAFKYMYICKPVTLMDDHAGLNVICQFCFFHSIFFVTN